MNNVSLVIVKDNELIGAAVYSDVKPADSQLHKSPPSYSGLAMRVHNINNGQAITRKNLISCVDKLPVILASRKVSDSTACYEECE
ncbi:hypothetical protein Q3G72_017174 [Acer saccharum]|nr:hypothetical protein Q3G72_017174 [Acer saccharum]